ncbi:hypothetical protein KFL_001820180 [Klebsormidium nitens]|uniref:Uncharacterized protein n=1 Tax=Klebsormidium nitens TaxID=105231 RepID=A0A1Y1I028_KLENI|nr:hypothetical protein KFL_001820180 [Klebsormidium nitens]|eukprot:GAQ84265.1 hypothetical protein KFL_001820180 [Klebsormidium nitens]
MGKKRKAETSGMEEVEKGLYSSFCAAANSISQLYTQAQSQQRLSFAAGQRHAMDQVYQWVLRQRDAGATQLSADQLLNFLQRELDTGDIAVSHFSQQAAAATAPAPAASPPPATSISHHARVLSSHQAQASGQPPLPQTNSRGGHAFTPLDRSTDLALIDNKAQMFGGTSPQRRVLGSFAGQWTQGGGYDRGRASGPQHQGGAAPGMFGAATAEVPGGLDGHQHMPNGEPTQEPEQQGGYGGPDDDFMM